MELQQTQPSQLSGRRCPVPFCTGPLRADWSGFFLWLMIPLITAAAADSCGARRRDGRAAVPGR